MPNFQLDDEEAGKITAFLLTLPRGPAYAPVSLDGASAEEGKRLVQERGCRGCHAMSADEHSISPRVPNLAGIASKVTPEWLDRWIADPKAYNADTAMPKLELKDEERHAIVAYLMTLKRAEPLPPAPDLSGFSAEDGRQLVKRYECFGCHAIEGFEKVRPSVPKLARVRPQAGQRARLRHDHRRAANQVGLAAPQAARAALVRDQDDRAAHAQGGDDR